MRPDVVMNNYQKWQRDGRGAFLLDKQKLNIRRINEKISDIKEAVEILSNYASRDEREFLSNPEAIRSARYSFIVLAEAATNIATHLCARLWYPGTTKKHMTSWKKPGRSIWTSSPWPGRFYLTYSSKALFFRAGSRAIGKLFGYNYAGIFRVNFRSTLFALTYPCQYVTFALRWWALCRSW